MKVKRLIIAAMSAMLFLSGNIANSYAYSSQSKEQKSKATFKEPTYTISYDLDGGAFSTTAPTKFTSFTNTFSLPTPTKSGYTFAGWQENQDKLYETGAQGTVSKSGSELSFVNSTSGNNFSWFKIQIFSTDFSQWYGDICTGPKNKYVHSGPTGTYILSVAVNGSLKDYRAYYSVYLEQGKTYISSADIKSASSQKFVVDNVRFYQQGGSKINIPVDVVAKGSVGNRSYTAIWAKN